MSTQSYPWFKFAHVEYLLDPMVSRMSLAAQGANTRLMAYAARQLPFGTLPNDEITLLAMSGAKSLKAWQKLHCELMGNTWLFDDDGRWFCPLMVVESAPVVEQEAKKENKPKKALTNAERQAAHKARQKELALLAEQSNAIGNGNSNTQVTDGNEEVTERNVTSNDASVTFEGGKGGDLDLDKKIDLDSLKTSEDKSSGSLPANASSGDKPVDDQVPPNAFTSTARQTLWTVGVPLLMEYGQKQSAARSFLGQMVKKYGEDSVADAVTSARTTRPMDATEYIGGFLKKQTSQQAKQSYTPRQTNVPDNNSTAWMTPELEAQLNAQFAA